MSMEKHLGSGPVFMFVDVDHLQALLFMGI